MVVSAMLFLIWDIIFNGKKFGSIGQLARTEGIANKSQFDTVLETGFELWSVHQMLLIRLVVWQQVE